MVVLTKLIPPRMREDLILREKLLSILENNIAKKLIFLSAGPGYGKTSLLLQFLNKSGVDFVWYSPDKGDGTPSLFIDYLAKGIEKLYKGFGRKTIEIAKRATTRIEIIAGALINEIVEVIDKELFIILDDYHVLNESLDVNRLMVYLLNHQPRNFHLIISSRTKLLFSIADLKLKGEALEIAEDSLSFSRDEMSTILNLTSEEQLSRIHNYTGGWPAGVYLISQTLKTKNVEQLLNNCISSELGIFDYFTTQVFELQSNDIQDFLLKSSILEYMTPAICKDALDIKESAKILDYLYKNNLFISQVQEDYKYHQLFRDFLIKKAVVHYGQEAIIEFHLRAGKYFKETKNYPLAIEHLIEGKDYENAARLIEQVAHNMIESDEFITVEKWINSLPESIVRTNPILNFNKAQLFRINSNWDSAIAIYRKVLKIFKKKDDIHNIAKTLYEMSRIYSDKSEYKRALTILKSASGLLGKRAPELQAPILNSIGSQYYYLGKYKEASRFIKKALKISEDLNNEALRLLNLNALGVLLYEQGEFRSAIELYEKVLRSKKVPPINVATTQVNLANIYTKQGEYKKALSSLETSLRISNGINDLLAKAFAYARLGELYYTMGDKERALKYYQDASEYNKTLKNAVMDKIIGCDMSLVCMKKRDFSSALNYIDRTISKEGSKLHKAYYLVRKACIKLAMEKYGEAESILNQVIEVMKKVNAKYHLMMAYYYLGLTYLKKGEKSRKIKRCIRKALTLSEDTGCHHFLVKEGENDDSLLRFALEYNVKPDYVRKLLPGTEEADLKILLFGYARIFVREREVKEWKSQRTRSMFLYFVANRKSRLTKDKLINIFWRGFEIDTAKRNLYPTITYMRKAVGIRDIIVSETGEYRFNPDYTCWIDTEEFERVILEAKRLKEKKRYINAIERYEKAIKFYKGDFLENISDSWCEEPRSYFSDLSLKLLIELGDCFFQVSKSHDALEYYKKALSRDKYMEEVHCKVMKIYATMGNQKAVKEQYAMLVKTLKEELNELPLPRTTRLYYALIKKRTLPR